MTIVIDYWTPTSAYVGVSDWIFKPLTTEEESNKRHKPDDQQIANSANATGTPSAAQLAASSTADPTMGTKQSWPALRNMSVRYQSEHDKFQ